MASRFISASEHHLQITVRWRTVLLWSIVLVAGLSVGAGLFQGSARKEFPVDMSGVATTYVNFCRVSYMPEEVILDLGLNSTMEPNPQAPVKITHRLVLNYYTLKRMTRLFTTTIEQFESTYGPIEVDANKRVKRRENEKE